MKTKRIMASFCAAALAVCVSSNAFAAANTDWPQFSGSPVTPGITAVQTPAVSSSTEMKWSVKYTVTNEYNGAKFETNACGTPITVGDFVYLTVSDGRLLKLDAKTGKIAASVKVTGVPLYFSQIAYGDGRIYVPQQTANGVKVSAFDAKELTAVWQSNEIRHGSAAQQIASPVTYFDGRIYFGTYTQDPSTYAYNSGVYVCLDAKTGNIAWQQANDTAGYYWDGGAIVGSAIAVSDAGGTITSYGLTDGRKISSVSAGGPICSSLCYAQGRIYASVKSGYVFSAKADASGTIYGSTAEKSAALGSSITSSPVVYNGRLYLAGGGYGSTAPFSVLDAATLKTIYQISGIHSQSTPLISTAYGSGSDQVYIYVTKYGSADQNGVFEKGSSCVYVIGDRKGQTKPSYGTLFTPPIAQSCSQSLTPACDGTLYYFNDSGTLYAVGRKNAPTAAAETGKAAAAKPLSSPKTGELPAAGVAVLLAASGAILVFCAGNVNRYMNSRKKNK